MRICYRNTVLALCLIAGVDCLAQGPQWQVYNNKNSGLPENKLKSIAMDNNGNIWLGTAGDGGVRFDRNEKWEVFNETTSGISNNHVDSIAIDRKGNIWFGTGTGVCMFDGDTTWITYTSENSGLPNDDIYPVAIDRSQASSALRDDAIGVWIGTYGDGVVKFDGKEWTTYKSTNSPLIDDLIRSIAIDKDGNKWIGTLFGGIAKFNGDATWAIYTDFNSGLPSNAVYPICFDADNNIWIGTEGGLAKFDGKDKWEVFDQSNSGLPDNKVYSMKIDGEGIIWIGTVSGGLARFDPRGSDENTSPWTVYNTLNSGLPFNEVRGIAIDGAGIKWVATYGGGLARFDEKGAGWKNTGYDDLYGFDPSDDKAWTIANISGLVRKFDIITDADHDLIASKLDKYLKVHSSDVDALILYAKLGLRQEKYIDKLHEMLDKALEMEPDNAEANYWKARLYGIRENVTTESTTSFEFRDYTKAVKFCKTAISVDPENNEYRETLALYLSAKRRFEEARIFTKHAANGKLPVYLLLRDLQIFPLPSSVVFLPDETKGVIQQIRDKGEPSDYLMLRVQVFAVPITADALESFYESRLPEFSLFETQRDKKAKTASFKQYLKIWDKEMYTTNAIEDVPERPKEGVTLDVDYIYRKSSDNDPPWISEMIKNSPSLADKKTFCKIVFVNYR